MLSFVSSPISKVRSHFGGTSSSAQNDTLPTTAPTVPTEHHLRQFSMASSVTVAPPSPIPPTHSQPSTLATLQYQQDLIADFWSGSAARTPVPPTASSHSLSSSSQSHSTSSHGSMSGKKSKWAEAIMAKDGRYAQREPELAREPRPLPRLLFLLGFLFPLLWLAGAMFLCFPRKPSVVLDSLPRQSTQERERRVAMYRVAEDKWAKRCLWAWVVVMAIASVLAVAVVVATKSSRT